LNWHNFIRQTHRWLSLVFTVTVVINIAAMVMGSHAEWVGLLALVPLLFLLPTGLYLFALPYMVRGRGIR
jgi:hypothetical protein